MQVWRCDRMATLATGPSRARRLVREMKTLIIDTTLQITLGAMRGEKGQAQETSLGVRRGHWHGDLSLCKGEAGTQGHRGQVSLWEEPRAGGRELREVLGSPLR